MLNRIYEHETSNAQLTLSCTPKQTAAEEQLSPFHSPPCVSRPTEQWTETVLRMSFHHHQSMVSGKWQSKTYCANIACERNIPLADLLVLFCFPENDCGLGWVVPIARSVRLFCINMMIPQQENVTHSGCMASISQPKLILAIGWNSGLFTASPNARPSCVNWVRLPCSTFIGVDSSLIRGHSPDVIIPTQTDPKRRIYTVGTAAPASCHLFSQPSSLLSWYNLTVHLPPPP